MSLLTPFISQWRIE